MWRTPSEREEGLELVQVVVEEDRQDVDLPPPARRRRREGPDRGHGVLERAGETAALVVLLPRRVVDGDPDLDRSRPPEVPRHGFGHEPAVGIEPGEVVLGEGLDDRRRVGPQERLAALDRAHDAPSPGERLRDPLPVGELELVAGSDRAVRERAEPAPHVAAIRDLDVHVGDPSGDERAKEARSVPEVARGVHGPTIGSGLPEAGGSSVGSWDFFAGLPQMSALPTAPTNRGSLWR